MTAPKIIPNVGPLVELDRGKEVPGVDPVARRLGGAR